MDYHTAYSGESFGSHNFGLKILVAVDRALNENDEREIAKLADKIKTVLMTETFRLDPKEAEAKAAEKAGLLEVFGDARIFAEEIPNGYCGQFCCSQKPWYVVTTTHGRITIGWRKRVIQISWTPDVGDKAEVLFAKENVTKSDRMIHAWGYEKAAEYIQRLIGESNI